MPAFRFRYWSIDREEEDPQDKWSYLDPDSHRGMTEVIGVNAPTMKAAFEMFDDRFHSDKYVRVHSIEYIGPGVPNNESWFEADERSEYYDGSLGYWRKAS